MSSPSSSSALWSSNDSPLHGEMFDVFTAASLGQYQYLQQNLATQPRLANATNLRGWTPLLYAACYGHYNAVRVLAEAGADVNKGDLYNGVTPLMQASTNGHTRSIEMLLDAGADLNIRDFNGKDAARYAKDSGHGSNKLIKRLLKLDGNRYDPSPIGPSPRQRLPSIVIGSPEKSPHHRWPSASSATTPRNGQFTLNPQSEAFTPGRQRETKTQNNFALPPQLQNLKLGPVTPDTSAAKPVKNGYSSLTPIRGRGQYQGTPQCASAITSSPAVTSSTTSPPLPSSLRELLDRFGMQEYMSNFSLHGVDLYTFMTLNAKDLQAIGINQFGHLRKLHLAQLRYMESVEVRSTQETIFADFLLAQREELYKKVFVLESKLEQILQNNGCSSETAQKSL